MKLDIAYSSYVGLFYWLNLCHHVPLTYLPHMALVKLLLSEFLLILAG